MNTLWTFGCSFTNSLGISHTHAGHLSTGTTNVQWFQHKLDQYAWSNQLGSKLGLKVVNYSKGGGSVDDILRWVIKCLPKIQEGDVVVLGQTFGLRLRHPKRKPEDNSWTNYLVGAEEDQTDPRFLFTMEYLEPKLDLILNDDTETFSNLVKCITSKNVKVVWWDWNLWTSYETWREWSNNELDDGHFSINGNTHFSMDCYKALSDLNLNGKMSVKLQKENVGSGKHSPGFLPYREYSDIRNTMNIYFKPNIGAKKILTQKNNLI